jgi:hypothetical protein
MDDEQYRADLETLVKARTEQLRQAVEFIAELVAPIKPFRPDLAQKAVEKKLVADKLNLPPRLGGEPENHAGSGRGGYPNCLENRSRRAGQTPRSTSRN